MTDKQRTIANLTDAQVQDYAKKIAANGTANYPPGKFEEKFGHVCFLLAGIGYSTRLAPALKAEGFEISLKLFPEGLGCEIHERRI